MMSKTCQATRACCAPCAAHSDTAVTHTHWKTPGASGSTWCHHTQRLPTCFVGVRDAAARVQQLLQTRHATLPRCFLGLQGCRICSQNLASLSEGIQRLVEYCSSRSLSVLYVTCHPATCCCQGVIAGSCCGGCGRRCADAGDARSGGDALYVRKRGGVDAGRRRGSRRSICRPQALAGLQLTHSPLDARPTSLAYEDIHVVVVSKDVFVPALASAGLAGRLAVQYMERGGCTCPVACAAAGALRPPARRWARWMNDRTVLRSLVKCDRTTSSVQPHCRGHATQVSESCNQLHACAWTRICSMMALPRMPNIDQQYKGQSKTEGEKPHPLRQHARFVLAEAVLQREERQQHLLGGRRELRLGCR